MYMLSRYISYHRRNVKIAIKFKAIMAHFNTRVASRPLFLCYYWSTSFCLRTSGQRKNCLVNWNIEIYRLRLFKVYKKTKIIDSYIFWTINLYFHLTLIRIFVVISYVHANGELCMIKIYINFRPSFKIFPCFTNTGSYFLPGLSCLYCATSIYNPGLGTFPETSGTAVFPSITTHWSSLAPE